MFVGRIGPSRGPRVWDRCFRLYFYFQIEAKNQANDQESITDHLTTN